LNDRKPSKLRLPLPSGTRTRRAFLLACAKCAESLPSVLALVTEACAESTGNSILAIEIAHDHYFEFSDIKTQWDLIVGRSHSISHKPVKYLNPF
jgi:hypothetical protein